MLITDIAEDAEVPIITRKLASKSQVNFAGRETRWWQFPDPPRLARHAAIFGSVLTRPPPAASQPFSLVEHRHISKPHL